MKKKVLIYIEVILTVAAAVLVSALVSGTLAVAESYTLALILSEVLMLAVAFGVSAVMRHPLKEVFPLDPPPIRKLLPSIAVAVGAYFVMSAVSAFTTAAFPTLENTTDAALYQNYLKDANIYVIILAVVIVPAVCEELIFRGYVLNRLSKTASKPVVPIIVTGLIFSLVHADLYKLLPVAVMGIALSYIAVKTGSVLIPMILHMLNNALSIVMLFTASGGDAGWQVSMTPSMLVWSGLAYLAAGVTIALWGMRLFGTLKIKRLVMILLAVGCVVFYFICSWASVASVTDERLDFEKIVSSDEIADGELEFELDRARMCSIQLGAYNLEGVDGSFIILDAAGESVMSVEGTNPTAENTRVLEEGKYLLRYSVSFPDDGSQEQDMCMIYCRVTSFYPVTLSE